MQVIAERHLGYRDDAGTERMLVLQLGLPEQDPDGTWRCAYRLGEPYDEDGAACGEDSLQALLMALKVLGIKVQHPPAPLRGRLTWLGMPDLGLPVL